MFPTTAASFDITGNTQGSYFSTSCQHSTFIIFSELFLVALGLLHCAQALSGCGVLASLVKHRL